MIIEVGIGKETILEKVQEAIYYHHALNNEPNALILSEIMASMLLRELHDGYQNGEFVDPKDLTPTKIIGATCLGLKCYLKNYCHPEYIEVTRLS